MIHHRLMEMVLYFLATLEATSTLVQLKTFLRFENYSKRKNLYRHKRVAKLSTKKLPLAILVWKLVKRKMNLNF